MKGASPPPHTHLALWKQRDMSVSAFVSNAHVGSKEIMLRKLRDCIQHKIVPRSGQLFMRVSAGHELSKNGKALHQVGLGW